MTERPILFSGPMVRAILDGKKTQTRRVIRFRDVPHDHDCHSPWLCWRGGLRPLKEGEPTHQWQDGDDLLPCPYGFPGDRLWVRETFTSFSQGHLKDHDLTYPIHTHCPHYPDVIAIYRETGADFPRHFHADGYAKWKPSIFMPRWASRITLEVCKVRVERVQDITDDDICREIGAPAKWEGEGPEPYERQLRLIFSDLWNSINAKRGFGWEANPWVWVVEFRRVP